MRTHAKTQINIPVLYRINFKQSEKVMMKLKQAKIHGYLCLPDSWHKNVSWFGTHVCPDLQGLLAHALYFRSWYS